MESVKLFYCVKRCDETDCVNNHISKVSKIEENIFPPLTKEKIFIYLQVYLDQNRHVSVRYFIISGSRNKINNVALL